MSDVRQHFANLISALMQPLSDLAARELAKLGADATGIDWAEKQIEHAIRLGQGPTYETLDAAKIGALRDGCRRRSWP